MSQGEHREEGDSRTPPSSGSERDAFVARLQRIVAQWRSADRIARAMGVSPSAFRKWLKGEAEPSRERLVALARTSKVSIAWLATGEGPEPEFGRPDGTGGPSGGRGGRGAVRFVTPPMFTEAAFAGSPDEGPVRDVSDQVPRIGFEREWVQSSLAVDPEKLALEMAVGDSMQPTIADGDLLLIDLGDRRLREFGVYLLRYEDARLVKRVQRKLDHSLLLISDNPIYEPERIPSEKARQVEVIGRVVWRGGRM
ncbi:MAG TPA: helix-turn-helix transcriptional regulator [Acetobacteraceae bacterium]|nr:helix-turn-helix transcriptional regulator [Acetobacteraceae bacterium]